MHKKVILQEITKQSTTKSTEKDTNESAPVREYSQRRAMNRWLSRKSVSQISKKHLLQKYVNQNLPKELMDIVRAQYKHFRKNTIMFFKSLILGPQPTRGFSDHV